MNLVFWIEKILHVDYEILTFLSYNLILWGFVVLIVLQLTSAPYGRYSRDGWGTKIEPRLAWFIQEIPAFLVPLLLLVTTKAPMIKYLPNKILLACFLIHYFQRSFIFPYLMKSGRPTPLIPFLLAFVFCLCNGYLQAGYIITYADFGAGLTSNVSYYLGIILFFVGMAINIHADHVLRNLRKPGEKGYKIPHGGMYNFISCPNFFGEILEWSGFAIANGTVAAISFAIFTACNIGPRACQHHKWYQQKFEDYPKKRKALIPFVL
ncbi:hypothetical protein FSP39_009294 [Pinctada imbricata]|uniref:3-oxo-5alpha-steroid 4-dehydrogenase (NADP(+)) n=1 Tax=Pinctada imbricata TaxID=66713 RepID=A0AA89BSS7_PINIB|nr:hypothetical protein FSP39_009294 [Pinctada imbricata]